MSLNWIKETDLNMLKEEYQQLVELIGIEAFIKLLEHFDKTYIYFSRNALIDLKRDYILKHPEKQPKELSAILDINLSLVYRTIKTGLPDKNQINLFDN